MKHLHSRLLFTLAAGSAGLAAGCAVAHDDEDDEADDALPMGINVSTVGALDAGVYDAGVMAIDAGSPVRTADAGIVPVFDAGSMVAPEPHQTCLLGLCALPGIIIRHEQDASGAELPVGIVVRTESP